MTRTDYQKVVNELVGARRGGLTLRESAEIVGVHVATVCRWQVRDPELRHALVQAAKFKRRVRYRRVKRPHVVWHRDCPQCSARVVVRSANGWMRFWRCSRWPCCDWTSW